MSISIEALKEAINIKESIAKLEARLAEVFGLQSFLPALAPAKRGRPKKSAGADGGSSRLAGRKKGISPEGRARIAAAQKARWAKKKAGAPAKAAKTAKKGKRKLSSEGRAKIVAALKARWAKVRAAKKKSK